MTALGLIGTGLIGSSVALAARAGGAVDAVIGYDRDPQAAQAACELGIVDTVAPSLDAFREATPDGVCVAVPTQHIADVVDELGLAGHVPIFDVGSVKLAVVERLRAGQGVPDNFVPCHPIAGSERSGPQAASADLFSGRKVVLSPLPETQPQALAWVRRLWESTGARVTTTSVETHDRGLALTSHLPHLVAFAYMMLGREGDSSVDLNEFAGPGFRDFTRIAAAEPSVWADILCDNALPVAAYLEQLIPELQRLADLARNDRAALEGELREASQRRRTLDVESPNPQPQPQTQPHSPTGPVDGGIKR